MNNVKQGITINFLFFFSKMTNDIRHICLEEENKHFKKCLQTGFNRTKVTDWPTRTFKAGQSAHRVTPDACRCPVANHDTLHWFTKKKCSVPFFALCSMRNSGDSFHIETANDCSESLFCPINSGGVGKSQRWTDGAFDTIRKTQI